ncbi:cadherin-87A [Caerostris extrusa]|uniref:Cadherin-87A n=1 Tax=Caerostris extrusa TaxID=172846 RepID=A0AAV4QFC2_CAEEX|nr:cadherin-87A [Caerostris extrusa]
MTPLHRLRPRLGAEERFALACLKFLRLTSKARLDGNGLVRKEFHGKGDSSSNDASKATSVTLEMLFPILVLLCSTGHVICNSPPIFLRNIDLAVIKENTPIGSIFFNLLGSDPENSTVTYGLEGTDRFQVNSSTGVITVAAQIDREVNDSLRFYVTLEDVVGNGQDNNVVRVPVTVIILDENDNEPDFHGTPYEATVLEASDYFVRFFSSFEF